MTVPSLLERAGDFSQTYNTNATLAVIYDPTTGTPATRTPFTGNRIPAARLDPVALNVLKAYPLPNRQPDNVAGANNFAANPINVLNSDVVTAKADYSFTDAQRVSFRSIWNQFDAGARSVFADPAAESVLNRDAKGWNLLGSWTSILRPTLINEVRVGFVTRATLAYAPGYGTQAPAKLGLRGIPDESYPRFNINGYTALGSNNQYRDQAPIQQPEFADTVSWIKGSHSLRIGADVRRSRNRDDRRQLASGAFTFTRGITGLTGRATTGNGIAALLLGSPSSFQAARPPIIDRSSWYVSGFIQDDWQISRNLVLNLGIRWELDTPFATKDNILNSFDPLTVNPVSGTRGVIRFAGVNGFPESPHNLDRNNFAPRVGLAWKPFGNTKTVIRTGFGIFFAAPYDGGDATLAAVLGYGTALVIPTGDNGTTIPFTLSQPIPVQTVNNTLDDRYGAVPTGTQPTAAVTFFDRNRATGYSMQMNLNVQREVAKSMMVSAGYIGNLQRKMPGDPLSLNQIPPSQLTPASSQINRPYPQFSDVQLLSPPIGVTNYHAFIGKAEKRFSGGFNLLATYTYAKALSNTTQLQSLGNSVNAYSNAYDRRADYGPSENDIRHRLTWASVYQIPYGRGRRFGSSSLHGRILGNWSVSSVLLWQTAPPLTVTTSTNTTQAFSAGPLRADVIRDPNLHASQRSVSRWFDVDAFAQPAANQFGNQGVNIVRGSGRTTLNAGLLRDIPIREGLRFQLRGEAFNLFNHANFGLPGQTLGAANFGVISSAASPRQLQIGLRCIF
ncbi:MAG: hypothetical protein SGI92_33610 [Bryobacteraceae bacterium]|nr:hypothetical protein [Bryobacteraceae bacterium]